MEPDLQTSEAPPLFLVGAKGQAELVNSRAVEGYYQAARLIEVAELHQPTLSVRPGWPLRIIVDKNLHFDAP